MDSEATELQPFYERPKHELRQGDIVRGIAWGAAVHELTLCRPKNASQVSGVADYAPKDAVKGMPPAFQKADGIEIIHARAKTGLGMIMWQDCQLDYLKNRGRTDNKALAAVAPIIPISTLDPKLWDNLVNGRRPAAFYLPPDDALDAEGFDAGAYVDLRYIWPLNQRALQSRVVSISREAVNALVEHLFWFFTAYRRDGTEHCSHCGSTIHDAGSSFDEH